MGRISGKAYHAAGFCAAVVPPKSFSLRLQHHRFRDLAFRGGDGRRHTRTALCTVWSLWSEVLSDWGPVAKCASSSSHPARFIQRGWRHENPPCESRPPGRTDGKTSPRLEF